MQPTLQSVLAELQAIDTTSLDNVVTALNQAITDLQTVIAAGNPSCPTVVSVTVPPVTVNLSDGSSATVPVLPQPPQP